MQSVFLARRFRFLCFVARTRNHSVCIILSRSHPCMKKGGKGKRKQLRWSIYRQIASRTPPKRSCMQISPNTNLYRRGRGLQAAQPLRARCSTSEQSVLQAGWNLSLAPKSEDRSSAEPRRELRFVAVPWSGKLHRVQQAPFGVYLVLGRTMFPHKAAQRECRGV